MWKSACVGVYQLLNWKMHGETLEISNSSVYSIFYQSFKAASFKPW